MRIRTDFICVMDLEATCWKERTQPGPNGEGAVDPHVMEIIEIGAVMLKMAGLEVVGEFCSFVRPAQAPTLSDFCKELTTIRQEDIDAAKLFPDIYGELAEWLQKYSRGSVLLASHGLYDYRQLMKDCAFHVLPFPFRGDHLNLKEYCSYKMGWSKRGIGQGKVLDRLGIKAEGTRHRGIDDARMAARILQRIGYAGEEGHFYRPTADTIMRKSEGS